jgi:hypothetical protein
MLGSMCMCVCVYKHLTLECNISLFLLHHLSNTDFSAERSERKGPIPVNIHFAARPVETPVIGFFLLTHNSNLPNGSRSLHLLSCHLFFSFLVLLTFTRVEGGKSPLGIRPQSSTEECPPLSELVSPNFILDQSYAKYNFVRNALIARGWKEMTGFQKRHGLYDFKWTWTFDRAKVQNPCQLVNHFPGHVVLDQKDSYMKLAGRYYDFPSQVVFNQSFYPLSVQLETLHWSEEWKYFFGNTWWIVKDPIKNRGEGLNLVHGENVRKYFGNRYIVQKYMENPHLIHNRKYDLRVYALITSRDPLVIFVSKEFYVRFSSKEFSMDTESPFVHFTNFRVQMHSEDFHVGEEEWQWDAMEYRSYVGDAKFQEIYRSIKDVIVSALKPWGSSEENRKRSFELIGVDIIIDADSRPWVLEFNVPPGLHINTAVGNQTIPRMVNDLFHLVLDHESRIDHQHCSVGRDVQEVGVWELCGCFPVVSNGHTNPERRPSHQNRVFKRL